MLFDGRPSKKKGAKFLDDIWNGDVDRVSLFLKKYGTFAFEVKSQHSGRDCLEVAVDLDKGKILDVLLALAPAANAQKLLARAFEKRADAAMEVLLKHGGSMKDFKTFQCVLHAADGNSDSLLKRMVKWGTPVDARDEETGNTVLIYTAGHKGYDYAFGRALAAGADIHAVNHQGVSALRAAVEHGFEGRAAALVKAGAKPTAEIFSLAKAGSLMFGILSGKAAGDADDIKKESVLWEPLGEKIVISRVFNEKTKREMTRIFDFDTELCHVVLSQSGGNVPLHTMPIEAVPEPLLSAAIAAVRAHGGEVDENSITGRRLRLANKTATKPGGKR